METFVTKKPKSTFLYLKVQVKANSLLIAWTNVKLFPGEILIAKSSPETTTGCIPANSHGWYKLGRTTDFQEKRLVIETQLPKTENVEIFCALLEDDDLAFPFIHYEEYTPKAESDVTRLYINIE